jgi:tetratricopeptide (TPR) repeat protein
MARFVFPAFLALALLAQAETANDGWKDLIVKASYAAGEKDLAKAEQIFLQALHEAERFGATDPRVATTLNDLGQVYRSEKKYADADGAYRRAYAILEKAGGDAMPLAETSLNIAVLMFDQGQQSMALPFIKKTLNTYEAVLDANNERTATVLCMLGDAYRVEKDFQAAEEPLKRCGDIREMDGGVQNPDLAEAMHSLALVYEGEGRYDLADPRFKLAEKITESTLGITSPALAQMMEDHAILLRQMGRQKDAARLDVMAAAIRRNQKK